MILETQDIGLPSRLGKICESMAEIPCGLATATIMKGKVGL